MSNLKIVNLLQMVIIIGFLSSCAHAPASSTKVLHERKGVSTILIPAAYDIAFFTSPDAKERHCLSTSPDFTVEASGGISLGGIGLKSIGENSGQSALGLGGRSPAVLITRELMYRACELTANIQASPKVTIKTYERFLQTIEKALLNQTENGTAPTSTNSNTAVPTTPSATNTNSSNCTTDNADSDNCEDSF